MANVCRYLEGWDHGVSPVTAGGGLTRGITGSPTVGSAYARNGGFGMQINPVASADESWDGVLFTGQVVAATSVYCRPVTLDTSSKYYVHVISAASGGFGGIGVDTSNNWIMGWSDNTTAATGVPLVSGKWTLLELLIDFHANPWTARWRIDGVEQPTPTGFASAASTEKSTTVGAFSPSNRTVEFWFDDLVMVDGTDQSMFPLGGFDIEPITADQAAAADHQSLTVSEIQYTDNFSSFTNFTGNNETDSRSRLDDLSMADGIQIRGSDLLTQPVIRAVGVAASGGASAQAIAAPAGLANGDLEIMVAGTIAGGSISITTAGGGAWTAMTGSPIDVTGGEKLYVWWRIFNSGTDSNPSITPGSDHVIGQRLAYAQGTFDSTTPFENVVTGTEATSDTSFSFAPGGSTTQGSRLVACVASTGVDSASAQVPVMTNAALGSLTSRMNSNTLSGGGGGFGYTDGTLNSPGSVGTFACTYANASPKAYISFAIRPLGIGVGGGSLNGNARWPVADPPQKGIPRAVSLLTVSREATATGTSNAIFRTLVGASTTDHFNADPSWGVTPNYLYSCMDTKPGGGSWALTDVNGINFEADSTDAGPAIWLGGFIYQVAFQEISMAQTIVRPNVAAQRAANW